MDKKIIDLGDALMALSTAEAVELEKYLESKGLKPAQPVAVAVAAPVVEEAKESATVNVLLKDKGTCSAVKLVKPLMPYTGKNAMETKKLVDVLPAIILEKVSREVGKAAISDITNELGEFGKDVVFELQDC